MKPNFFVVGAPKCGTTSLAAWLDSHPQACMSRPKEPHFFYPHDKGTVRTLEDYEGCFAHALPHHKAIGEASTNTIYSVQAIEKILRYRPQAKFIVCLRDPVDMVISLHNHYFFSGQQRIEDFEEAWNSAREIRPVHHDRGYRSSEFYRHLGALGTHCANVKSTVPEGRLLILLLGDMIANEARELRKVTDFLEISPSAAPYPRENVAMRAKSIRARRLSKWILTSKQRLGIRKSLGIGTYINRVNTIHGSGTSTVTPELREQLSKHFGPEVRVLEELLDRDLSHWTSPALAS